MATTRGRPKLFDWQLPVHFTSEQRTRIEELADAWGISYAEAVRGLVDRGISYMILVEEN